MLGVVLLVDYDDHYNHHHNHNYNNNDDTGLSKLYACLPSEHNKNDKIMLDGV